MPVVKGSSAGAGKAFSSSAPPPSARSGESTFVQDHIVYVGVVYQRARECDVVTFFEAPELYGVTGKQRFHRIQSQWLKAEVHEGNFVGTPSDSRNLTCDLDETAAVFLFRQKNVRLELCK